MKNSFRGVFHCRKTKAWFCFAREFNGLRHRIRRYIHVPQGSSDLVRTSLQTAAPDAVFERYCTPLVCRPSGPGVVAGKVADAHSFRPRKTVPGLRANDAMAGLLTHRSTLAAAFPEQAPVAFGPQVPGSQLRAQPRIPTVFPSRRSRRHHLLEIMPASRRRINFDKPMHWYPSSFMLRPVPATQRGLDLCGCICRGQRWPIIGPCPKQKVFRARSGV